MMKNKKLKFALHELEQEMEVIRNEELTCYKGGSGDDYFYSDGGYNPSGNGIYIVFSRGAGTITIYSDNGTPDLKSDDVILGQYTAHNNVVSGCKGEWPNGIFKFIDKNQAFHHGTRKDKHGILLDSPNGAYGSSGIFRVEPFYDESGDYRNGMGIHSGREYKPFEERKTQGCIRTNEEAMQAITKYLKENNGHIDYIEVKD